MIYKIIITLFVFSLVSTPAFAKFDWIKKSWKSIKTENITNLTQTKLSDTKIGQGLKETLKVGITNTVTAAKKQDSFLKNEIIKIHIPEKLQMLDKGLRMIGLGSKVDDFVISMNKSAEKAAPFAEDIFMDALFDMSFEDVQEIYKGKKTAATDYFQKTTYDKLYATFKPTIIKTLNTNDVSQKYNQLIKKYQSIPFSNKAPAPDIYDYVIKQTLNGLFHILGEEEKKIRTDPKAQTTQLLKTLFKK